jgi:hypothetical protein
MWFMPVMPTPGRQEQEDREFTPTWVTQWDLAQKIKKKWKHLRKSIFQKPIFPMARVQTYSCIWVAEILRTHNVCMVMWSCAYVCISVIGAVILINTNINPAFALKVRVLVIWKFRFSMVWNSLCVVIS